MPAISSSGASAMTPALLRAVLLTEISLAHGGISPARLRIGAGDDPAVDEHGEAVGEREHRLHVVLDQQDRHAALELAEHLHHPRRFLWPHAGHRLVEEQEPRPRDERHRNLKLAVLAMTESRDAHARAVHESDAGQRHLRGLAQLILAARVAPEAKRVAA